MIRREEGQALIEAILLGLILLVPVIWALGVLADMHAAALASTAAAREAGFDAAHTTDLASAQTAIATAVRRAFDDQNLDPTAALVDWQSSPSLARGSAIEVRISYPVTVLQVPLLGRIAGPSVWIRAQHVAKVDPYRSR